MDGELLSLKWNNHRTTFLHVIGSLRNKAAYTDATLACEGKFYPVHRLVLSTCSEYFGAIFEKTPCKSPVVVLKDIECKNLEFLLDYMYIGEVNVRQNELAALIRAAECLRIKGLAVPDEDPSLSTCNSSKERLRSESHRDSSPPAKRRRNRQFSNDERKYKKVNQNIEGSVIESSETNNIESQSNIPIKLEPTDLDSSSEGNFQDQAEDNIDELRSDEGGGTEDNDRENTSTELQEFFKCTVEKEEPISLSDYSSDFAGPSGVQNSNITPWESESSFATEGLPLGTSNSGTTPADSQHQQQMWKDASFCTPPFTFERKSNHGNWKLPCGLVQKESSDCSTSIYHHSPSIFNSLHSCPYCPYTSSHKGNLVKHVNIHTGEKPYQCTDCNYRSADRSHVTRHFLSRHSK